MKKTLFLIAIVFTQFNSWAQGSFPSENSLFTVNYLKGCVGTEITVTPANQPIGTRFLCFDADLSDIASNTNCFGSSLSSDVDRNKFTYDAPGIYNILYLVQIDQSNSEQAYDSITIEIVEPEPPSISLSNCSNGLVFDLNSQLEVFDLYTINFGDGSPPQEYSIAAFPFTYNYADPAQEYTITIDGSFNTTGNNNCSNNAVSKTIVPENQIERAASITSVSLLSSSSFAIEYTSNENQAYRLQIKENSNGAYQTIADISATSEGTYTFEDLNLNDSFYCVRLISTSNCDETIFTSNEACTIQFSANAQNNGNLLTWNHFSFTESELYKNGVLIYQGDAPYIDASVLCGQTDTYSLVVSDENGLEVESLAVEVSAITGSPTVPISQIATNVLSDSELELTWEVPLGLQPRNFVIYKKNNLNDNFFRVDTTNTNSFTDIGTAFSTQSFFYSVAYTNSCGGISPLTTVASNILLKANQRQSVISFSWNAYNGFDSLLSNYVIRKYDENMNQLAGNNLGIQNNYRENIAQSRDQLAFYQVEAYSENGLIARSNLLRYKIPSNFFVPTGFTPNQSPPNEELKVVGKFIEEVEFSVYNRWGTLIFRSNSLEIGWDGFLPNRPAPEGTYTYTVRVKDKYGEEYYKSGVFNLIR